MSVGTLSALSSASLLTNSSRLTGMTGTKSTSKAESAVDDASQQVRNDQQTVDEKRSEADRKAAAAQQAADELKTAKAAVARDQAALSQAKNQAKLDVYT